MAAYSLEKLAQAKKLLEQALNIIDPIAKAEQARLRVTPEMLRWNHAYGHDVEMADAMHSAGSSIEDAIHSLDRILG
jgi:hypothetical protein